MLIENLKLCTQLYTFRIFSRHCSVYNSSSEVFQECFGFSSTDADRYIRRNRLFKKDSEHLLEVIKCCRSLGFKDDDIIKAPAIFRHKSMIIEQRYLIMEEGGFQKITPHLIGKYRYFYSKSVRELKREELIAPSTDVAQSFISYLDPCPPDFEVSGTSDGSLWSLIQRKVVTAYLKWRLNATNEEVEKLFRIHRMIAYKCMRFLCENIRLALDLGLTTQKIIKHGYILHNYPKYTNAVLKDLGDLAGIDIKDAMRRHPKLMMISPKNYIKIYGILKEFNISDEAIRRFVTVFQLSPDTVRLRLEEISRLPELKVLMSNPRILSLVIHHNRARSRLTFMQKLQLKCADRFVLGSSTVNFDDHIREGKDINSRRDVMTFLSKLFKKDQSEFRKRFQRHPYYQHVPLLDMQETYDCLKENRFHNQAIYRAFHILLYPREKVTAALSGIENYDSVQHNKLSQVQRLNLVLYHIEKDHHFTGNGIWRENRIVEIPETKQLE